MTMRVLLIDIGNSRTKWALSDADAQFSDQGATDNSFTADDFERRWREIATPTHIVISNVTGAAQENSLQQWFVRHWRLEPWFLRGSDATLGITNEYAFPEQLGSDRLAALLGVRSLIQGDVAVVDCGTAVTIDWLDAHERFRGGVIFPGPNLLSSTLGNRAAGIPQKAVQLEVPTSVLGTSTASCVTSGVHFGLAGAIDRILNEINQARNRENSAFHSVSLGVYLTGGNAERLRPFFQTPMTYEPDLVLLGLLEALRRKC